MAFFEADEDNFDEILSQEFDKGQKVILKFGSEFCEPCFALESELEELYEKHKNVTVISIDCNESPELAQSYKVFQLPTMIIFEDRDNILHRDEEVMLCQDIEKILGLN